MDTTQTPFDRVLEQVAKRLKKVQQTLLFTKGLVDANRMDIAYAIAFDLANEAEKMALLTRALPAYTGHPKALNLMEDMLMDIVPVKVGYTKEGWFAASLPALLPKKNKGSAMYIHDIIYPAMSRFFAGKNPVRYPSCVLIIRHVYNRDRHERQYRDHDNIELNMVVDAVAFYVMKDDSALRCKHYYCSAPGELERTEVYVVPQAEFTDWLLAEKTIPNEGVELFENCP